MLTCKEVATAIGQDQLRTGSWTPRLRLRLHLLMCRHCRRYATQVTTIGEATRRVLRKQGDDTQALERIRERVLGDATTRARSETRLPGGDVS